MSRRNKSTEAEEKKTVVSDLKVLRAKEYKGTTFLDLEVNGVKIYGCRYIEGKNGDFISFPSYKAKDGKYYNYAYVELDEAMINLIDEQLDKLLGD